MTNSYENIIETKFNTKANKEIKKSNWFKRDLQMIVNGAIVATGIATIVTALMLGPHDGQKQYRGKQYLEPQVVKERVVRDVHTYAGYAWAGLAAIHGIQYFNQVRSYFKARKRKKEREKYNE